MDLIRRQQFEPGIAELETAYRFVPRPNVLYNIARAYNDSGNTERALEYLRRYLQADVPDRAEVDALVTRLEARQRQNSNANSNANANANANANSNANANANSNANGNANANANTNANANANTNANANANANANTNTSATDAQIAALQRLTQQLMALAERQTGGTGATSTQATTSTVNNTTAANANANANANTGPQTGDNAVAARDDENEYEEQVVTASRVAQSPLDAPNATGVITAQDIRLSGLTSIPDLLRRLAGIDVMQLDSGDAQVSIRGFNQRLSNKLLVLVDGRSVYLDFLGVTMWPTIFPSLEDIDRIEVIRGPGSALYGADAYTGVVNIITRPPGEQRTQISAGGGTGQQLRGVFAASGRSGDFSYRGSVGYEQRQSFGRVVGASDVAYESTNPSGDFAVRGARFLLEGQSRLGRGVVVRAGVGGSSGAYQFTAPTLLRQYWLNLTLIQPFVQLDWQGFTARAFWNRVSFTAGPVLVPVGASSLPTRGEQDVIDLDANYTLRTRAGSSVSNVLQFGAGYRMKSISWNYLDNDHTLHFASGFIQDTLRIGESFSAVASARVDYHPVLATPVVSPRGAIIIKPSARRAIRLTGGTAFRTPTMLELYLDLNVPTPTPGVSVLGYGGEVYSQRLATNGRLRPESAISVDLGFQDQTLDVFSYEINAFFTRAVDLIDLGTLTVDPLPGALNPDSRAIPIGYRAYRNDAAPTYLAGGELGLRLTPVEGLDFNANYTLSVTLHDPASTLAATNARIADQRTPMHKLNVGLQVRTRFGLEFESYAHYVASQTWVEQTFDSRTGTRDVAYPLNDYLMINARLGLRLLDGRLQIGVTGTNLADVNPNTAHREHPLGYRQWARVMANLSYRF